MQITNEPLANIPRALLDGELIFEKTQAPVLISAGNHKLIVLQSQALYQLLPGQEALLTSEQRGKQEIVITDVDRLAMVATYEPLSPPINPSSETFELSAPE